MNTFRKLALLSVALAGVAGFAGSASANTWTQTHPRRIEVNHRLHNLNARIASAEYRGEISPYRASWLAHKDARIRHEERLMASLNHGHITRAEQRVLNAQENQVSKRIP